MCDNDHALVKAATEVTTDVHRAAGAEEAITIDRFAHLVGGSRMAATERSAVVAQYLRSFAVHYLAAANRAYL